MALRIVSQRAEPQGGLGSLTAFSAVWAQCTKATIPIVPIVVPSNVNFEAVDIGVDLNAYACDLSKCSVP